MDLDLTMEAPLMLVEAAPMGTQLIQMCMYTLHRQDTSLWLTSWIPKHPLHLTVESSGVQEDSHCFWIPKMVIARGIV